jgi:6-pyruvoyltetrahydropterin/6-carboxytetrahydropterin synthase
MSKFYSTKTYGTDRGLSCCFRQWRATHSHCSTLHGYSIGIKLVFGSDSLDDKNWVMDFGGLKGFKAWADDMFDHTLVIAKDDPHLSFFQQMANMGSVPISGIGDQGFDKVKPHERSAICDLRIVDGVGCEMFAKMCYDKMTEILCESGNNRVYVKSAEVFEHAGNSAIYEV